MTDRNTIDRFAQLWWDELDDTFVPNTYLGVSCLQHPFDAWIIQELLCKVKPSLVVELGTWSGGGALLWASVVSQWDGRVLTVDVNEAKPEATGQALWQSHVTQLVASSVDPDTVAQITEQTHGETTFVIVDSDHHAPHVEQELHAYAPLVTRGSYMVVLDTLVGHFDRQYAPGPDVAVQAFLDTTNDFEIDATCERMIFTHSAGGFLRRLP